MEEEIIELREEIDLLSKKIEILEKNENKRKALTYTKILFKVIMFLLCIYGAWKGYEYVVNELPKIMDEKIREINPVKDNQINNAN